MVNFLSCVSSDSRMACAREGMVQELKEAIVDLLLAVSIGEMANPKKKDSGE